MVFCGSLVGNNPASVRIRNVTTTGFDLAQVEPEYRDGAHVAMTVNYLVVEVGLHQLADGTAIEVGMLQTQSVQHNFTSTPPSTTTWENVQLAGTYVEGWDEGCTLVSFPTQFTATPIVLANKNTRMGYNGGWLRRCVASIVNVGLTVDEDTFLDNERSHVPEDVGVIVFSQSFN